ncbi:RimJ/RimL family protein N-acetyltransferase [Streptomyces griseochromogenes]|uniref:Acetyltransferase n=1 Tax=Streptomyces griseochromogenes TaxID=68214 RepID=A0A1B1B4L5_9ACTN|nr:GNAT family protein [Streptomyces griseochromogenes]ANP53763.1 acetyltransferase [Streptomyces griseochromogenes]MBP2054933.1 RimJ/RimL family protein N-acetyltransferase [Streptomyces griseochromogenes]
MASSWTGERVRLRAIEPDDWAAFTHFADDDGRPGSRPALPRSAESYRAWAKEQAVAKGDGDRFRLAVETTARGELVGTVGSHRTGSRSGWFEFDVTIGADHRRKGYATEAVVLLLRFMFAERRYHKCLAVVLAHNEASLALFGRLGFTEEGRLREHVFLAGRHHDLVMMGMLADEFDRRHTISAP